MPMILKNFSRINNKQKIFYHILISTIAGLILVYLVILPVVDDIKLLRAEIINQKIDLEKKLSQEKNMSKLSDKVEKIEPRLESLNEIFIDINRQLEFITTLEGTADRHNVSQKIAFDPSSGTRELNYIKAPLNITAQGSFNDLINYLVEIEKINYYINITSANFTAQNIRASNQQPGDSGINTPVSLSLTALTYWK